MGWNTAAEWKKLRKVKPQGSIHGRVTRAMEQPKNWLPVCEAENAQIFSNNLAVVETKLGGKVASMPLDEHNNYDGNPYGVTVSPDGKYAFVEYH